MIYCKTRVTEHLYETWYFSEDLNNKLRGQFVNCQEISCSHILYEISSTSFTMEVKPCLIDKPKIESIN